MNELSGPQMWAWVQIPLLTILFVQLHIIQSKCVYILPQVSSHSQKTHHIVGDQNFLSHYHPSNEICCVESFLTLQIRTNCLRLIG